MTQLKDNVQIILCTNVKLWHDGSTLRHNWTGFEALFKHPLTHLLRELENLMETK